MKFYLIGSLRNSDIPLLANKLRTTTGHIIFDDWFAAGPHADDAWRDYEKLSGASYVEALEKEAARHVFEFDYKHLNSSDGVILALPAGRSGHIEFGWAVGKGKRGYVLLDRPDRWDVMYKFATGVFETVDELIEKLQLEQTPARAGMRVYAAPNPRGLPAWPYGHV